MGHVEFVPVQRNWKWFEDDNSEPTVQLAAENTTPTLPDNTSNIRLRIDLSETAGGTANNQTITLEYSTNDADFIAFGAANHWDYADGQATEGNNVTSFKLTGTDTFGIYEEGGGASFTYAVGNELAEWDVCIVPTGNVSGETTYYFRALLQGVEVPLDGGESHPEVLTAEAAAPPDEPTAKRRVYRMIL